MAAFLAVFVANYKRGVLPPNITRLWSVSRLILGFLYPCCCCGFFTASQLEMFVFRICISKPTVYVV